ncbi:M10 family metallopeptidase C-terminal domain-containing protein [Rhizobium sp. Root483D2]|uniref:calcium-binding protein n=1 Tax=Rhizobium sp. Root483D2 TaxID=1736545 RepID=UPI000715486F|nr:M10 family metallopeptidase C-terminal domain-containing protein [Rhizobium sp. Root483D2]KQY31834.1 hypothetical protein ASD32_04400 [Rhizobium sp. Root483D2]
MPANLKITMILKDLPEDTPLGTEIATISTEMIGVSFTSVSISSYERVYVGMLEWENYPSDLFEIVGAKIVLKSGLDYEKYDTFDAYNANFAIDATLSDGTTARAIAGLQVTDAIEEIRGTGQADKIFGTNSMDYIITGSGNDQIRGSAGDDVLYGGTGGDRLWGGEDADTFLYKAINESTVKNPDIIYDWQHIAGGGTRDVIDLRAIDARSDYSGNQPFKWLGATDFNGKKGQLNYNYEKDGDTHIYGDLNGDKKADFEIVLDGKIKMYADDFLL